VLLLIIVLLLLGAVLAGLLAAWSVWFQGYIYSEPAADIFTWRAPAAGGVLMLFIALWVFLDYSDKDYTRAGRYRTLFEFSSSQTWGPFEEIRLFSIVDPTKEEGRFKLMRTPQGRNIYRKNGSPTGTEPPSRASKLVVLEKGQEVVFEPEKGSPGQPVRFLDKEGRVMVEGQWGQVSLFRTSYLLVNLLINALHLVVWFLCLWLLLQFQWSHALLQALVAWIVMTLVIIPPILTMAEEAAKQRQEAAPKVVPPS